MDMSKLSPAPWEAQIVPDGALTAAAVLRVPWGGTKDTIYFGQNLDDAEFMALARNAFDVMMRRGWGVVHRSSGWFVPIPDEGFWNETAFRKMRFPDPFTALVESDKWYREHVEGKGP